MLSIRYTLIADGSSDAALKPVIEWLIAQHRPDLGVLGEVAHISTPVGLTLEARIPAALKLYPCDLLIVHRDAEGELPERRRVEIEHTADKHIERWVPLIPVRMTEAWLLSDESAIRSAAENKHGTTPLNLPRAARWEELRDAKEVLFDALILASGKSARALRKFNPARQRALVAQRTHDFGGLRGLPSFDAFETALLTALQDY